jgi:hypothetical protein
MKTPDLRTHDVQLKFAPDATLKDVITLLESLTLRVEHKDLLNLPDEMARHFVFKEIPKPKTLGKWISRL